MIDENVRANKVAIVAGFGRQATAVPPPAFAAPWLNNVRSDDVRRWTKAGLGGGEGGEMMIIERRVPSGRKN